METRAHHILIGAFTLAAAAAALLFTLWLSRSDINSDFRRYDVVFNEAVSGLSVGSAVQYSGIRVGEVERLWLDPQDPRRVWARIQVSSAAPIKTDTTARLALLNITGASGIELGQGTPSSALLTAAEGVPVIEAEPSSLTQLRTNSEELMISVTELLDRANAILAPENAAQFGNVLANMNAVLTNLSSFTAAMNAEQGSLREGIQGLVAVTNSLDHLLQQLDEQVLARGAPLIQQANEAATNLAQLTERLDTLVNDNSAAMNAGMQSLSELEPAMQDLRAILSTFSDLSRRLEEDPAGFLLGNDNIKEFTP